MEEYIVTIGTYMDYLKWLKEEILIMCIYIAF